MSFTYSQKVNMLEVGTTYKGKITNISLVAPNTDKERVLVNVQVEGFASPQPASFYTGSDNGSRMLTELLSGIDATPNKDINKVFASCVGKEVNVRLAVAADAVHINTNISAPTRLVEAEIQTEETMPLMG